MVLDPKIIESLPPEDLAERLSSETDALVATSAKLVKEMNDLLERARQLKAAHDVLLAAAHSNRRKSED